MESALTPLKGYDVRTISKPRSALKSLEETFSRSLDFAPHLTLATFSNQHIEIAAATVPNPKLSNGDPGYVDSGDFYDVIPFSENRTGLIIADSSLSGKEGVVHATDICGQLREYLANESVKDPRQRHYMDPSSAMERLSKRKVSEGAEFCSLLYVDVMITDSGKGKLSIYSAGHNFPILYSPTNGLDKKEYEYPQTRGIVIGFDIKDPKCPAHTFTIERGAYIVLFTDGVTESRRSADTKDDLERSGLVGFVDDLVKDGITDPKEIVNTCLATLNTFNNKEYHSDDVTLMVARIK